MFGELWMENVWLGWKHRNESRINETRSGEGRLGQRQQQKPCSNVFNGLKIRPNENQTLEFTSEMTSKFRVQISTL